MLFYTSLFVASLIVALVVLWLYRSLLDVGRAVYRAILPSSKSNITSHVEKTVVATTINDTPTPWGWKGNASPAAVARTNAAVPERTVPSSQSAPWGWPGHKSGSHNQNANDGGSVLQGSGINRNGAKTPPENVDSQQVGWPYREEQFDFAGDTYKVTRKVKPKKTNLKKTVKPWGW